MEPPPNPLHLAVWDDDQPSLSALLLLPAAKAQLEGTDRRGNTPLLLAYRLGRTCCARMLLAAGAYPKARTPEGWEAIHVASLTGNPDLVRTAVLAYLAETDAAFSRRLASMQANLESMPDFSLAMEWKFTSWIPLVSGLLPSDTLRIYKRGSSLRIDSTLLGMSGLRWERGNISLLMWGRDAPLPGAVRVLDHDSKTGADARLAFTRPKDQQVQDWVRKLLTQRQKVTDFWSRDVVMTPCLKQGLLGRFAGAVFGGGAGVPRGRVSDARRGVSLTPPSGGGGGGAAAEEEEEAEEEGGEPAEPVANDPRQVREDVGGWGLCEAYDMLNLCVRDVSRAPILGSLPLERWWRPAYSLQTTDEEAGAHVAAEEEAGAARAAAAAGAGADAPPPPLPQPDEPEKLLRPLLLALRAIRSGKVNERNAASATLEQLEGMGFEDSEDRPGGSCVREMPFEHFFGVLREDAPAAAAAAGGGGGGEPGAAEGAKPFVAADGRLHAPLAAVAQERAEAVATEDKTLDLKVYYAKNFPITVKQFLPIAEVLGRTSSHAANFKRFFRTKMPPGAGFPVRFSIPVFPTITATITAELCDTRRSPPASLFKVPPDYKMCVRGALLKVPPPLPPTHVAPPSQHKNVYLINRGAYVERGFIRQL
jgi:hypothetical protein